MFDRYKEKKIAKTSFLDASFMKNLESALRFGCPLLVQDVEHIDPVLNPVLNKEIHKTGGRVLIKLGDQEIDFSPSFNIFLFTRDPTSHFTPDLCSRVTFVNFTVTPSSLQSQCLYEVLKVEQPAVHKKRTDLLKAQGEFKVKLRSLEKQLLDALNAVRGNILDNDTVIGTLETLKREAADIAAKMAQADQVMEEIGRTSELYTPLALACARIYFALEALSSVHFLYQFSLRFFLDVFHAVLHRNPSLDKLKEPHERLAQLLRDLFRVTYLRVSRTLLHEDALIFAVRLAQIKLQGGAHELDDAEFDFLLKGGDDVTKPLLPSHAGAALSQALSAKQQLYVQELSALPAFAKLREHMAAHADQWKSLLDAGQTDPAAVPADWETAQGAASARADEPARQFRRLLLLKGLRPDLLLAAGTSFVSAVFGGEFVHAPELNLAEVVEKESSASTPLLLASAPGFDASYRVDQLAGSLHKPYRAIAIGSAEGFELAEKSINGAAKGGSWVLLKNVHLAPRWLLQLEKKLYTLTPAAGFRLFMTAEIHPKLPASLLRQSYVFSFQPPPGIKANLQHTFSLLPPPRMEKQPVERARLYFLLAWFHAVVQERLRYAPLGWSKTFEFNEADQRCAFDTIDFWVDSRAAGRQNLAPDRIPWDALRQLLGQTVYGGRVDNEFDQRLLQAFLERLFTARSFDLDFKLVDADGVQVPSPEGTACAHFAKWVDALPDRQTPTWLGLPANAERLILAQQGRALVSKLLRMQSIEEDAAAEAAAGASADTRPAWIRALEKAVGEYTQLLPAKLALMERSAEKVKNPLFRCFEREVRTGARLLEKIRRDLRDVLQACQGALKLTNHLRTVMSNLSKGVVPKDWQRYTLPDSISLTAWFVDLAARIRQLDDVSKATDFYQRRYWLGGLFSPEAFMTATRQAAAQANQWSLESIELTVQLAPEADNVQGSATDQSFVLTGLTLEGGAAWDFTAGQLALSNDMTRALPPTRFRWRQKAAAAAAAAAPSSVSLPVYLDESRRELLFALDLQTSVSASTWYQRGAAITAWSERR